MQKTVASLTAVLAALLIATGAQAQTATPMTPAPATTITKDQAKVEHDRIEAAAKADKKACESMKGNAEDVCEAEAEAREKIAKAELKHRQSGDAKDAAKLAETRAEAEYEVAKEKCEDLQGAQQSDCKKQAKATEQAAKDAAKSARS